MPSAEAESLDELKARRDALLEQCRELTPADPCVPGPASGDGPRIDEYIQALFTDFFEQRGDRECSDDPKHSRSARLFTVIGHRKGSTLEENMHFRFGMPEPDGYRKALRLMEQAEKFGRPIITFIDTRAPTPARKRRSAARERPSPATWRR